MNHCVHPTFEPTWEDASHLPACTYVYIWTIYWLPNLKSHGREANIRLAITVVGDGALAICYVHCLTPHSLVKNTSRLESLSRSGGGPHRHFFTSGNTGFSLFAASTSSIEATATTTPLSLMVSTASANSLKSFGLSHEKKSNTVWIQRGNPITQKRKRYANLVMNLPTLLIVSLHVFAGVPHPWCPANISLGWKKRQYACLSQPHNIYVLWHHTKERASIINFNPTNMTTSSKMCSAARAHKPQDPFPQTKLPIY